MMIHRFLLLLGFLSGVLVSMAQEGFVPEGIQIDTNGQSLHKRFSESAPPTSLENVVESEKLYIFPCCVEGTSFFTAIQLYYEDPAFNTPTTDWSFEIKFDLYLQGAKVNSDTMTLSLDMADQKIVSQVFHSAASQISSGNSFIEILKITSTGTVPTSEVFVNAVLYEEAINTLDVARDLNVSYNPINYSVNWNDEIPGNEIVDEYEVEWVFYEQFELEESASIDPFLEKTPTRITTKSNSYRLDQLFPTGDLYVRVRAVGSSSTDPNQRIYGAWNAYTGDNAGNPPPPKAIQNFFTDDDSNWQQVITFAEDGKNKKILTFYDGTLRPVQTLTNLNHENSTLIAESKYDYEGRKVVDFLPYAKPGWQPVLSLSNGFNSKADYDDANALSVVASSNASDNYYTNHPDPTVPRASGATFSQTRFSNDNTARVMEQSGIGTQFSMTEDRTTKYFYGGATKAELVLLFGETVQVGEMPSTNDRLDNIGDENHYRKILVQDPNEQVSVTYLDPQGRTIATALAGDPPSELDTLSSFPEENPITVDISELYTIDEDGSRVTYYKLLNVAPTNVTINYNFGPVANLDEQSCTYDLSIQVLDPDGFELPGLPRFTRAGISELANETLPNVNFDKVGEYTIIKKLTPNELSYEEAETIVRNLPHVVAELSRIELQDFVIDESLCVIDQEELSDTEFTDLVDDVITTTCDGIKSAIISELASASTTMTFSEIEADFDNLAAGHPRYCEYEFCLRNKESEIFDTKLANIADWDEASDAEFIAFLTDEDPNLLEQDPFFSQEGVGHPYKDPVDAEMTSMTNLINSYTLQLGGEGRDSVVTSIVDLVNPHSSNADLFRPHPETGEDIHILYWELEFMEFQEDPDNDPTIETKDERRDRMRWNYYRSFYLDAKNQVKIAMTETSCPALSAKFLQGDGSYYATLDDDGRVDSDTILSLGVSQGALDNISDQELDYYVQRIIGLCDVDGAMTLMEEQVTTIRNALQTYFDENPLNMIRSIPIAHLELDPLNQIQEILIGAGCLGLEIIADDIGCEAGGCNPYLLSIQQYIDRYTVQCQSDQLESQAFLVAQAQQEYLWQEVNTYLSSIDCHVEVEETFTYSYDPKEYHHTLYYYDRAGNLVQTVPPRGVNAGGAGIHNNQTRYYYNSLNQLVLQNSPDGAATEFRYDSKGQLRVSQNAQQRVEDRFSFTRYDKQGRIVEVGEFAVGDVSYGDTCEECGGGEEGGGDEGGPGDDFGQAIHGEGVEMIVLAADVELLNDTSYPVFEQRYAVAEIGSFQVSRVQEVTKTYYDQSADLAEFSQDNLRGRVSYVEIYLDETTRQAATYYSYDPHGNVKSLLQVIEGFEPKRVDYAYDLVSGNVNYVIYQYGQEDQFYHKYSYDGDNRITLVETSLDGVLWNREATYQYYAHGPLRRIELGEGQNLQGLDYYYTLQGWLKGVNAPLTEDPGEDELHNFGKDILGFNLGYYQGDFDSPRDEELDERDNLWQRFSESQGSNGLYNGNISWMNTWLKGVGDNAEDDTQGMQAMLYGYDQLNRITRARGLTNYVAGTGYEPKTDESYNTDYTYDPNGNLMTLQRKDHNALVTDNLDYVYGLANNRLLSVTGTDHEVRNINGPIQPDPYLYPKVLVEGAVIVQDGDDVAIAATERINFKKGFSVKPGGKFRASLADGTAPDSEFRVGTYRYDEIGNMIEDSDQGTTIDWTVYGKVDLVAHSSGDTVDYTYDAAGNRVLKAFTVGNTTSNTYYIRDASGNILAVYDNDGLKEIPIYGSSRLGNYRGGGTALGLTLGQRTYEVSNHLGNVMSTFTDALIVDETGEREIAITSASDYYPFGMQMPGRTLSASNYRYGFNGKEKDDDGEFGSTVYDYGFRIYNPRIAKFLSVDPLTDSYPWYTPYQFAGNKPIWAVDLDGLEEYIYYDKLIEENGKSKLKKIYSHTIEEKWNPFSGKVEKIEGEKWLLISRNITTFSREFDSYESMQTWGNKDGIWESLVDIYSPWPQETRDKIGMSVLEEMARGANGFNPDLSKAANNLFNAHEREILEKSVKFHVIVGSFTNEENAMSFEEKTKEVFSNTSIIKTEDGLFRISIGEFGFWDLESSLELRNEARATYDDRAWVLTTIQDDDATIRQVKVPE